MADKKISQLTAATLPLAGTEVLPIVQSSTTDNITVNNLAAGNLKSQSTTGVLQVSGPTAGATRVMTTPDANFTAARTDAGQSFTGIQQFVGSGGQNVRIYGGSASHQWDIYGNGTNLRIGDNTGAGVVQYDNDISMNNSNLIQGTAAKGINFTANTPAAGKTSQLLNWYEEGTWTPNQGAGLTVVGDFSSAGTYTRIGRMVFVSGEVSGGTSVAIPATGFICTNLPFTTAVKSTGGLNTGTLAQVGQVILYSGTSLYGTTTSAASTIYFSIVYSV